MERIDMMKLKYGLLLLFLLPAMMLMNACKSSEVRPLSQDEMMSLAVAYVRDGRLECILISGNDMIAGERGRGVNPLLGLYDCQRKNMEGATVVDKVVGRAAAAIAICGKVRHVHGEVMSRDAAAFLKQHGITASHNLLVDRILNRKRDGLCPLEASVQGIDDPEKAVAAIRQKIESMKKQNSKPE